MKKIKHRKQMRTTTILLIGKKKNGMVEKKIWMIEDFPDVKNDVRF